MSVGLDHFRDIDIIADWHKRCKTDYFAQLWMFGLSGDEFGGKRVLDAGCGPKGGILSAIPDALQRTGWDILLNKYVSERLLDKPMGVDMWKVDMSVGDRGTSDGWYDAIFCINALDHGINVGVVPKAISVFSGCLDVGGRLYLHFHARTEEQLGLKHLYPLDAKTVSGFCESDGLAVVSSLDFDSDPLLYDDRRLYSNVVIIAEKQ